MVNTPGLPLTSGSGRIPVLRNLILFALSSFILAIWLLTNDIDKSKDLEISSGLNPIFDRLSMSLGALALGDP
jgi:hypothetical protein